MRALYNGMFDKQPLLIAEGLDAADVVDAMAYAREYDLPVAIRGGGHNGPGLAASTTEVSDRVVSVSDHPSLLAQGLHPGNTVSVGLTRPAWARSSRGRLGACSRSEGM